MRKNVPLAALAALSAMWIFGATGLAQDFQKTYSMQPDSSIRIRSISGEVRIQGYDGARIEIEGFKIIRNCDRVEIVDRSTESQIDVDVRYPQGNCNASVNFKVRVPRNTKYSFDLIRSISGNVYLTDVAGRVKAESISGFVQLENIGGTVSASSVSGNVNVQNVNGMVSASSTSGNVEVYLRQIEGSGDMVFSSISGNVQVRAPQTLDANVTMSTLSGRLKTDFEVEVQQKRYGPGYSARGRLGTGTHNIQIRSVSGAVSLMKDVKKSD
jgi:DUF4097 and DUF4098 domain-containing protein YvlB